jgi:hypothetical protein
MQIDITGVDLVEFAKAVYELSAPQGLGFFHFREGSLSTWEANQHIDREARCVLDMDYVNGRACKMHVRKDGDKLLIDSPWYDHTDAQLEQLLAKFNIKYEPTEKHNTTCNCVECR